MKKVSLIFLVVAIIAAISCVVFLQLGKQEMVIEEILPDGPLVYLRLTEIEKNLKDFTGTQFWKKLKAVDYKHVLEKTGTSPKMIANYEDLQKQLSSPVTQQLFNKFFGSEVALAVYPLTTKTLSLTRLTELSANVFFVTRLKPEVKFAEFFTGLFTQFQQEVSHETVSYKKHTIHMIKSKSGGLTFGYVRIRDLLVFGVGDKPARMCIDVFDKEKNALSADSRYLKTKASYVQDAHVISYINFELFAASLKEQILQLAGAQQAGAGVIEKQIEEGFKQMQGFKSIGYSGSIDDIVRAKFDLHFDKNALMPDIRTIYNCPPQENQTISFIPQDVLAYQWSTCYDFNYNWQQTQKELQRAAEASPEKVSSQQIIAGLEEKIQLSIENDILPALGQEIGGYLEDVDTNGLFPIPKILIFVKMTSQQKAEKVIQTLIVQQPLFRPESENYGDSVIKYIAIPFLTNLQPGYAFLNNYLLIATNRQSLKNSIDVLKGTAKSVTSNQSFQVVNRGFAEKNNSVFFIQFHKLMEKAQLLVDWGNQWVTMQSAKQEALKKESEQRLTDITSEIESAESEIESLRKELRALKSKTKAVNPDASQIKRLEELITEKQQTVDTAEKSIQAAKKKEKEMVESTSYEDLEERKLRLAKLRGDIREGEVNLEKITAELNAIKLRQEKLKTSTAQREELQKSIARKEEDIQTARDSLKSAREAKKEVEEIISGYDAQPAPQPEKRQILVEELIKPGMQAFSSLKALTWRMVFGNDILETYMYLKME